MKLSKNFNLNEFIYSETAKEKGIDNTPSLEVINNIQFLVTELLQPLRDKISYPFTINSGYRSKELNKAVGGSSSSMHLTGNAADVTLGSKQLNRILLDELKKPIYNYDLVIDEKNASWVHISTKSDKSKNRHQYFKL